MFWVVFVVSTILYIFYKYIKNRRLPPGPIGIPILGNLLYLSSTQPYLSLTNLSNTYGSIYGLYLGSVYTVVISDHTLIREAFKNDDCIGRAPLYVTHGIMGGYGLICAQGDLWRDQRKLTIKWLKNLGMVRFGESRNILEQRIMKGVTDCLNALKKDSVNSYELDPTKILQHTIGNVMNDIVFGMTYDIEDETWLYLQHLQEEGVKHIGISGVVNFIPFLRFIPSNKNILKFLLTGKEKTHQIYDTIIQNIRGKEHDTQLNETTDRNCSIAKLFLKEQTLRRLQNDEKVKFCSNEQLRHLLADLFGAGVDTTLATLRWFLLFISNNKIIQQRIRNEIFEIVGSVPSLKDYNNLPYLKACIAETQRIRSVVPIGIPHGTSRSTTLGGYLIPKNTMIIPLQWAMHMNTETWVNPNIFNPDRFIDENDCFYTPPQFMPFQTGKRMCLGEELAKMLLFLYCSNIIYNFDILPTNSCMDTLGKCGITLTPHEYFLKFQKIKYDK